MNGIKVTEFRGVAAAGMAEIQKGCKHKGILIHPLIEIN
jgi:hypothetical protein